MQYCLSLSLPLHPLGTLMTRNELSSIVFTPELEEKLFLVHRNLQAGQGPKVHHVLVYGLCFLWASSRLKAPAEKEFFFFFFSHFYPETPPSSCSAPFILVKCNSVLDTCAHHIIMSTLVCGEAFWVCRAQRGHGDSSAPLLLGCENVPSDVWIHPLGALNPFPDGEARGV